MVTISEKSAVKLSMGSFFFSLMAVAGMTASYYEQVAGMTAGYYKQKELIETQIGVAQNTADRALAVAESAADGVTKLSLTVNNNDIKAQISSKTAELRELSRMLARIPDSCTAPESREGRVICDQFKAVRDERERLEKILHCYRSAPDPARCEE